MHLTNFHFYNPKNYLYNKTVKGLQGYGIGYRFHFNGQEKDDEVSGAGNTMTAEFWEYDSRLGRRWNIDNVVKHWESGYATFSNNPIFFVDPYGNTAGDYYSKSGEHLGNDGIDDNKGYVANKEDVKFKSDGKIVDSEKTSKEVFTDNHKEFQNTASLLKHESGESGTQSSVKWMAHTLNNALGNKSVNYKNAKSLNSLIKTGFSSAPKSEKSKLLSTKDNSSHANWARAGLIDVMLGNSDPTGGALLWDGIDFLKKGLNHPKLNQYDYVTIANNVLERFVSDANRLHPLINPNWTLDKVFTSSNAKREGWCYGQTHWTAVGDKTRTFSLKATGSGGATIFWKIY